MSILKIRDGNGNVQEILAIRGEDGKDYVLTEKDKQEIAAMISAGATATVDIDTSEFALKTDIPDVSGFALKTEIPDVSGFALKTEIPDVSGFAKKTEIPSVPTNVSAFNNDAGYLTAHQSLADYAKKTDLPNMGNYYTKGEVDDLIPDVSGYTTMGAVEGKGYQTATQVQALISGQTTEAWTFTLEDGSTVTKTVVLK